MAYTKTMMNKQQRLTGGADNECVEWHDNMCNHCSAFHSTNSLQRCNGCGVQTHKECYAMHTVDNGELRCDMCFHQLYEDDSGLVCEICQQPDCVSDRPTATDVMTKSVVYFGRTWRVGLVHHSLQLPSDSEVVRKLRDNPNNLFSQGELPDKGVRKMSVDVDGVIYVSSPCVVHSWCAHMIFKVKAPEWKRMMKDIVTKDDRTCCFCHSRRGHVTECFSAVNHGKCHECAASSNPTFHPSCARWNGMLSWVDISLHDGEVPQAGMVCFSNISTMMKKNNIGCKHKWEFRMAKSCPGLNMEVLNGKRITSEVFQVHENTLRKGNMHL